MISRGGGPITLVAIAGRPTCDWERELLGVFCREYPSCTLKQIGDVDDFDLSTSLPYYLALSRL